MPEPISNCPICGSALVQTEPRGLELIVLNCKRCGRYRPEFRFLPVSTKLLRDGDPEFVRLRPYLSAHLRQASEHGEMIEVRHDNWKFLAEGHEHTPVPRKLGTLLRLLGRRSPIGRVAALGPDDFVLLDAADGVEMDYLTEALLEQQGECPVGC